MARDGGIGLPGLSEPEAVRHYLRLSQKNYSIDGGMYPLGSCTMKYNPRLNEKMARLPGFADLHPLQPESTVQGALEMIAETARWLSVLTGMPGVAMSPAAGAHGELTGLMTIRAALENRGDARKRVLVPESAHGTNPASAAACGYAVEAIPANSRGRVDIVAFKEALDSDVAALMLTNPNTLGIFETQIAEICALVHEQGGFVYGDGANMNAMLGLTRPGDQGIDVLHLNLHKTFTTPHGGGGPGAGPVGVRGALVDYLPTPRLVTRDGKRLFTNDFPKSIGRVGGFNGNFGMLVRALVYIRELGSEGLTLAAKDATLNANYVRAKLEGDYELSYDTPTMHEVVLSDRKIEAETGVKTLDIAKRLMDYGFHPPTVYFPLIVPGALMIEPTETESREELDAFIDAMSSIAREAAETPELVKEAPHEAPVRRLDEVRANRQLVLRWKPESAEG